MLLVLVLLPMAVHAELEIRCTSPDGKFALGVFENEEPIEKTICILNKASKQKILELGPIGNPYAREARLVWSADSRRVAYVEPSRRGDVVAVYFRKGATFEPIALPEDVPSPALPHRRHRDGTPMAKEFGNENDVKGWLKSGALALTVHAENDDNEKDTISVTIAFDRHNKARVQKIECSAAHYLTSAGSKNADGDLDGALADYAGWPLHARSGRSALGRAAGQVRRRHPIGASRAPCATRAASARIQARGW